MAVLGISSYISTRFLSTLATSDGTAFGTTSSAASASLTGAKGVETALSGMKRGVSAFGQAIQGLNVAISYVNVTQDTFKKLSALTDEMIKVTERATKSGIGSTHRNGLNAELKGLIDKFQVLVRDVTTANTSYNTIESADFERLFRAVGLDKAKSSELASMLKKLKAAYDSDGNLALVTDKSQAKRPIRIPQSAYQTQATTLSDNGSGSFAQRITFSLGTNTGYRDIHIKDINNDGNQDIISQIGPRTGVVQVGNGDGTFLAPKSYSIATGGSGDSVSIRNVNGDSYQDILFAASGYANVSLGNSDGSYNAPVSYTFDSTVGSGGVITSGLVDQLDSNIDIVATSGSTAYVLLGNANGTFNAPYSFSTGAPILALQLGTIDAVAGNDLVVVDATSIKIFSGNADGSFTAGTSYAITAGTVQGFSLMDLDGDTDLDVAVTNAANGSVQILLNNADGTFQAGVSYSAGSASAGSSSVSAADINDDGDADLVIVNPGDESVVTLLGNGNGTFSAPITSQVWDNASLLAVGDINEDGRSDIAIASGTHDRIQYYNGLQETSTTTVTKVTTKQYPLVFSPDRHIKSRPDAYTMLADLKALQNQLTTNLEVVEEAFTYLANNVYMLRSVGLVFTNVAKEAAADAPQSAEALAQSIVQQLSGMAPDQVKQLHNLEALSVVALNASYLDNVKSGVITM